MRLPPGVRSNITAPGTRSSRAASLKVCSSAAWSNGCSALSPDEGVGVPLLALDGNVEAEIDPGPDGAGDWPGLHPARASISAAARAAGAKEALEFPGAVMTHNLLSTALWGHWVTGATQVSSLTGFGSANCPRCRGRGLVPTPEQRCRATGTSRGAAPARPSVRSRPVPVCRCWRRGPGATARG